MKMVMMMWRWMRRIKKTAMKKIKREGGEEGRGEEENAT